MGAASSVMAMTADDVAAASGKRKRPGVVRRAILRHEIDGPTLLVLDAVDVATLATDRLDQKKLLGAFREFESTSSRSRADDFCFQETRSRLRAPRGAGVRRRPDEGDGKSWEETQKTEYECS